MKDNEVKHRLQKAHNRLAEIENHEKEPVAKDIAEDIAEHMVDMVRRDQ